MLMTQRRLLLATGMAALAAPTMLRAQPRPVIDTIAGLPGFNRFVELVGLAGLTDYLRGPGPFTVFAPTDAAFNAAPSSTIQAMAGTNAQSGGGQNTGGGGSNPDNIRLRAFIQYHIITGQAVLLKELATGDHQLRTENGAAVLVRGAPGQVVTVSNPAPGQQAGSFSAPGLNVMPPAPIVTADIPAANGVVQAIGGVLFP